jgi:acyl carrier protein
MGDVKTNSLSAGMDIRERFQKFIEERFLAGAGLDVIPADESLLENGVVDSTGVLELIDFLEGTFHIKIMDDELIPDNLDSINKVVAFIERKIDQQTG